MEIVRTLKTFQNSHVGWNIMMESMWMFDINYVTWNNIGICSYVQMLVTLCMFSMTVPNYVIYIKRPHKFLRLVRTLYKIGSCT